jgi:hypothetical protein
MKKTAFTAYLSTFYKVLLKLNKPYQFTKTQKSQFVILLGQPAST